MKNIAGDRDCDRSIAGELERARIDVVLLETASGEVVSKRRGRLGPIALSRGWVYWVAAGPVPLAVAQALYTDPICRLDVRVDGQYDGPPPEAPWVSWYTPDGARVYPVDQQAEYQWGREKWPHIFEHRPPIAFHDDPMSINASGHVDLYHIDSEIGLRAFARTLRKHGIDQRVRPPWWDLHHPPRTDHVAAPTVSVVAPTEVGELVASWMSTRRRCCAMFDEVIDRAAQPLPGVSDPDWCFMCRCRKGTARARGGEPLRSDSRRTRCPRAAGDFGRGAKHVADRRTDAAGGDHG
jgi:hypothetical protein